MKTSTVFTLALSLGVGGAIAETGSQRGPLSATDMQAVSPALERYASTRLAGDLWKRNDLSPRDRSLVTVSAVIARNQTVLLPEQLELALKNGVTPAELSEAITHLAFYAGWGNSIAAAAVTKEIFLQKGIDAGQLTHAEEALLPIDEKAEAGRAARVEQSIGSAVPGLVRDTTDVLFRGLWLRPGLAPRDRSLVTLSALIANGQVQQIPAHLNRAMDNGLTRQQASGVLNHLAYYSGWPNAFSAAPVFKTVFEQRESK
ncbi:carboxymuconolactone decarboxylase family protein [Dickeya sp. ws52]|uniref:carboxymuconolactone decarboxylase family protein n=1 Tax=Dickeya sp. ws52 TaxID=2576377 RepID=UPI00117C4576|nr:carboxymuconolactone decarboxylase family protein [Dickeya sp. ws52]TYL43889.1 carboxymuconolactone decarboxylase family protein [Dickeya sp. ws52]